MDQQIEFILENETEGSKEILNKLKVAQKVLEVLETKEVESIEIKYKKEPVLCKCTSSID